MTKNLIFTSAGDNTEFYKNWISNNQNYDICVIYYGSSEEIYNKYKDKVKFIEKRKGSKFQNFYYFYNKYPEIVNEYEYLFILDDDIIFEPNDINKMFNYANEYNLLICQPSLTNNSAISWEITRNKPNIKLTYTSFVEVGILLFKKEAIDKLMTIYDPLLICYGVDYLAIQINGIDLKNKYAVIHDVKCINPHPINKIKKNNEREISSILNINNREEIWVNFAKKNNYLINLPKTVYLYIYADNTTDTIYRNNRLENHRRAIVYNRFNKR
jgi:hypothetical protein